jgi:hypothetical protein
VAAIQIRPGNNGRLIVTFLYTPERVDKIKTIQGKWWHPEEKHWKELYALLPKLDLDYLLLLTFLALTGHCKSRVSRSEFHGIGSAGATI